MYGEEELEGEVELWIVKDKLDVGLVVLGEVVVTTVTGLEEVVTDVLGLEEVVAVTVVKLEDMFVVSSISLVKEEFRLSCFVVMVVLVGLLGVIEEESDCLFCLFCLYFIM